MPPPSRLSSLPEDIIYNILQSTALISPRTVTSLSQTSKSLYAVYKSSEKLILHTALCAQIEFERDVRSLLEVARRERLPGSGVDGVGKDSVEDIEVRIAVKDGELGHGTIYDDPNELVTEYSLAEFQQAIDIYRRLQKLHTFCFLLAHNYLPDPEKIFAVLYYALNGIDLYSASSRPTGSLMSISLDSLTYQLFSSSGCLRLPDESFEQLFLNRESYSIVDCHDLETGRITGHTYHYRDNFVLPSKFLSLFTPAGTGWRELYTLLCLDSFSLDEVRSHAKKFKCDGEPSNYMVRKVLYDWTLAGRLGPIVPREFIDDFMAA